MVEEEFDGFDRDGEAEAFAKSDLHIGDADDFAAHIEERAAAIAGIDLGGSLEIKLAGELPCFGAENAFGDGALESERTADGEYTLAHRHNIGVAHEHIFKLGHVLVLDL